MGFFIQNGAWGLFILSFAEASFFPIPPDFVLLSLSILKPGSAIYYSIITSVASTLGGVFGYFIGMRAGRPVLSRVVKGDNFTKIEEAFTRYGGWAVAVAGFTPIPYKVFTIASGVFGIKLSTFFIAALLSRSARFILQGVIVYVMGDKALFYINRFLGPGSFVLIGLAALVYFIIRKVKISTGKSIPSGNAKIPAGGKLRYIAELYGEFAIYMLAGFCIAGILGVSFVKLATGMSGRTLEGFDRNVSWWVNNNAGVFMKFAAQGMGFLYNGWLIAAFVLAGVAAPMLFGKRKIYSFISFLALSGSVALQWWLKSLYQRPRIEVGSPFADFLAYSFPSGLILLTTAFVGYVAFLMARSVRGARRWGIIIVWISLILVAGADRIYLGISYPSDVLAGFFVGGVWLTLCVLATRALEYYKFS